MPRAKKTKKSTKKTAKKKPSKKKTTKKSSATKKTTKKKTTKKSTTKKKPTTKKATKKQPSKKKTAKKTSRTQSTKKQKTTTKKQASKKKTPETTTKVVEAEVVEAREPGLPPQGVETRDWDISEEDIKRAEMERRMNAAKIHAKYKLLDAKENIKEGYDAAEGWVRENPKTALAGAAVIGWLTSRIFRRKKE